MELSNISITENQKEIFELIKKIQDGDEGILATELFVLGGVQPVTVKTALMLILASTTGIVGDPIVGVILALAGMGDKAISNRDVYEKISQSGRRTISY